MLAGGYEESLTNNYREARSRLGELQAAKKKIKELEGQLGALAADNRRLIELNAALVAAKEHQLENALHRVTHIRRTVARYYGVDELDMISGRRALDIIRPRHVAMYLAKKNGTYSLPEIGRRFGNRDHTTVLSAAAKIERERRIDVELNREITEIEALLS